MELTKEYFDKVISTLLTKEEAFGTFATRSELASVKFDLEEVKEIVMRLDKRDREDSNFFRDILLGHEKRITKLEKAKA